MPESEKVQIKVLTVEEKKECIIKLRKLLKETDCLKNLQSDDAYLERFLYGTDFDVEAAYIKMKTFYELLIDYPDWFLKPAPLDKKSLIDKDIRVMLPEQDIEGRPIYIAKMANVNVDTMKIYDVIAVDDLWLESVLAADPHITGKGLCVILDIANHPWKMMKWMTPENVRLSVKKVQTLPFKDFRFHVVNKSFLIHAVLKMIWPFLPENIRQMVKFHFDDYNSLHQHIDPAVLPEEYGGSKKFEYSDLYNKLYDRNEEILTSFQLYRKL